MSYMGKVSPESVRKLPKNVAAGEMQNIFIIAHNERKF